MRDNATTVVVGRRVRLVPYLPVHVPTYNGWMQDAELLHLTGSEPLTLEEEQANQQSWLDDLHKVTFILCALDSGAPSGLADVTEGMCGDINAFLSEEDVDDDDGSATPDSSTPTATLAQMLDSVDGSSNGKRRLVAELEVMIAEPERRRQGLARESMLLFIHWLQQTVPAVEVLVVKINDDNAPSLRLFESLGFVLHKHLTVFEQTELRLSADAARDLCAPHWAEVGARVVRLELERPSGAGGTGGSTVQDTQSLRENEALGSQ